MICDYVPFLFPCKGHDEQNISTDRNYGKQNVSVDKYVGTKWDLRKICKPKSSITVTTCYFAMGHLE